MRFITDSSTWLVYVCLSTGSYTFPNLFPSGIGLNTTAGSGGFPFLVLWPDIPCQWDATYVSPVLGATVSQNLSCFALNCVEVNPFRRFKTNDTGLACLGDCPRFIPILALLSHVGILFSLRRVISSANTGQPNGLQHFCSRESFQRAGPILRV
jgi:hypothetical protein